MSATFTYNLTQQIAALVNRDFLTYLGQFSLNGTPLSEPFQWYDLVQLWPQTWPALLVYEKTDSILGASENTFEQSIQLVCRVQLSDVDRNICAQKMRAYLGALTLLFAHYDWQQNAWDLTQPVQLPATLAQLCTNLTPPMTPGLTTAQIRRIFVSRISYDEFGQRGAGFMMRGTANLLVELEEVQ